jgi:hypothetical protein
VELTETETMLLELLQEKEAEAQRQAQQRMMRFLSGVSARTGIPVDVLGIDPRTGVIADARIAAADRTAPDAIDGPIDAPADEAA